MTQFYWEDFTPGQTWRFGDHPVTEEEIIDFATRYDPLPMHLGRDQAKASPLGVFCASGLHTFALTQRLLADHIHSKARLIAGGAMDGFRLETPVLPGDRLSVAATVITAKPHSRREDAGWLDFRVETFRADGTRVLQFVTRILFGRRQSALAEAD